MMYVINDNVCKNKVLITVDNLFFSLPRDTPNGYTQES